MRKPASAPVQSPEQAAAAKAAFIARLDAEAAAAKDRMAAFSEETAAKRAAFEAKFSGK